MVSRKIICGEFADSVHGIHEFFCLALFFGNFNFFAMPYKEKKVEKLYYSIGEVADMFNVNISLIRYWEKEFDIIKPKKNKKGNRFFTQKDIDNFHIIFYLVKERGMTLKGVKKKLRENKEDTNNNFEVIKSLKEIRELLLEIKEDL